MKVYVASKFEEKDRVRAVIAKLESLGHTITYDWTQSSIEGMDHWQAHIHQAQQAVKDRDGVRNCDVFVLLGHPKVKGAMVELGIAIERNKTIIVVDGVECHNVFFYLAEPIMHFVSSDDEAVELVHSISMRKMGLTLERA